MAHVRKLRLRSARIKDVLDAKHFTKAEYFRRGFKRGWINKRRADEATGAEVVRLALWLEVPVEYLYDAAPEFKGMAAWEVAGRASLDLFVTRDPEGRQVREHRAAFEQNIAAHRENAPRTVAQWRATADAFVRGRAIERAESGSLERSVGPTE